MCNSNVSIRFELFRRNAQLIFSEFEAKPLLYGSLGLELLLEQDLNSDDIDILIPKVLLNEKWEIFKKFLEADGYTLVDLHEHTFVKDNVSYSYASLEGLDDFAGIHSFEDNGCFLTLTLCDYLKVYERSQKDGYRQNHKHKNDTEKIVIIKEHLNIN